MTKYTDGSTLLVDEYLRVKHPLRFDENGHFRVLFLGDPHGGFDMHPQVKPALETVVAAAKPDLVLFPGDLAGCHIGVRNEKELRDYLDYLMEYLETNHIPWAHVYGNHDDNLGLPNDVQETIYESYEWCVSKRSPEDIDGDSNYVLPILAHDSDEPLWNIWALDSHDDNRRFLESYGLDPSMPVRMVNHFGDGGGNDNPHFNQIAWYVKTSEAIERHYGRKVPSILFEHMPLPEYSLIPRNPYITQMDGDYHDQICSSELNFGLFASCLQRGDVKGIFCGHEHINSFTGVYLGIRMSYVGGINYECGCRDDVRGGRIVDFDIADPEHFQTRMLKLQSLVGDAGNALPEYERGE